MGRGGVEMNGSLLIALMRFTHSLSFFFFFDFDFRATN